MAKFEKEQIRQFINDNDLKTAEDVQSALKGLFSDTPLKVVCYFCMSIR